MARNVDRRDSPPGADCRLNDLNASVPTKHAPKHGDRFRKRLETDQPGGGPALSSDQGKLTTVRTDVNDRVDIRWQRIVMVLCRSRHPMP